MRFFGLLLVLVLVVQRVLVCGWLVPDLPVQQNLNIRTATGYLPPTTVSPVVRFTTIAMLGCGRCCCTDTHYTYTSHSRPSLPFLPLLESLRGLR